MNKIYKPIIGITGSLIIDQKGNFPGYERAYVNNDYIEAVINSGGIPFIIPYNSDESTIKQQVEKIDGLILSGGHDVNPLLWKEEPLEKLGKILPKRDVFDIKVYKYTKNLGKPILGICRGLHIINLAEGGTLYQDLSYIEDCYIKHDQEHLTSEPTHTVHVSKDSRLGRVLGDEVLTNSFHHLAIKDLADGFKITAIARDNVIEAIEKSGNEFILGVQWHPEMMVKDCKEMEKIFDVFVGESTKA